VLRTRLERPGVIRPQRNARTGRWVAHRAQSPVHFGAVVSREKMSEMNSPAGITGVDDRPAQRVGVSGTTVMEIPRRPIARDNDKAPPMASRLGKGRNGRPCPPGLTARRNAPCPEDLMIATRKERDHTPECQNLAREGRL